MINKGPAARQRSIHSNVSWLKGPCQSDGEDLCQCGKQGCVFQFAGCNIHAAVLKSPTVLNWTKKDFLGKK